MRLKCYIGNLDGKREGMVITTSQKKAAKIAETSMNDFKNFWHSIASWDASAQNKDAPEEQSSLDPMKIINYPAIYEHDALYTRPFDGRGKWEKA